MKVKKCGRFATPVTQALGAFDDNGLSTAQKFPCDSNDAVQEILDNMCCGDRGQSSQLTANCPSCNYEYQLFKTSFPIFLILP